MTEGNVKFKLRGKNEEMVDSADTTIIMIKHKPTDNTTVQITINDFWLFW